MSLVQSKSYRLVIYFQPVNNQLIMSIGYWLVENKLREMGEMGKFLIAEPLQNYYDLLEYVIK